ncbi:ABC-type sugar transport system, substrate-binding protein, contains N-terminal xre family HTH domain [Sporobacter termitidis DSM 10068]|uniref:ABC-type sugar transport system, substrate-binding protein, contains N-terminal xre family HTH domain n=1 Tax=Sporobacter termitidis DSM 10068 TaxID=1123282 RepID=A0A1M5YD87_9FIRM|nr:substrate-binding domain-containing protein [Sporobacter termitidis]SHI09932.1 ABC-type sugar transport system, substrate-binding protein, contains N-terminal xre family HTH domain [Sporobacter termitidis DSM 10068]
MKKVMAIVLALMLAASLFACGSPGASTTSPSASASASPSGSAPATTPSATPGASGSTEVGYYDPSYDYSKNKNYKVAYVMASTSVLYDQFSKAFKAWSDRANVTYNDFSCNSDNDLFITTIQTYADQGYDGLLIDPDSTIYPRAVELCNELKIPWMGCMSPALDDNGKMAHPYIGFDNYQAGVAMSTYNTEYAKKTWPDAKPSEIGAIFIGYSVVPVLAEREKGYTDVFFKEFPDSAKNYYFCDGSVTGLMNAQVGYDLVSATVSAHADIKYWLISGFFDDYTDGAARAIDAAGKTATTVCSTFGGSGLINQWDAGETGSAWRAAIYTDQRLYAEPIFFGLYALMSGQATPETLWPEWVNHKNGDTYASVLLPTVVITQDMYQQYLMWVQEYTGIKQNDYDVAPGNYTSKVDVPDSYKA